MWLLRSPSGVCLALLGLTFVSLLVAEELDVRTLIIASVFLIAAAKAGLIIDHFMEAKRADRQWRALYGTWVTGVTILLVIGHI